MRNNMGWQGKVRKLSELKRIAIHFGVPIKSIDVRCWRDNDTYWVWLDEKVHRVDRKTLKERPLP